MGRKRGEGPYAVLGLASLPARIAWRTTSRPDRYNLGWPALGMAAAGRAERPRWRLQPPRVL